MKQKLCLVLFITAISAFCTAQEPVPVLISPENNSIVSLMRAEQRYYLSPAERENRDGYDPDIKKLFGISDASKPNSVHVHWNWPGASAVSFSVQISETPDFSNAKKFTTTKTTYEFRNLKPEASYFCKVTAQNPDGVETSSASVKFRTAPTHPRWFNISGTSNVRDIGGWAAGQKKIKTGMIYRGSELDRHFNISDDGKKFLLQDLGIKTDLDLRGQSELEGEHPYLPPLGPNVKWVNIQLSPYKDAFTDNQKGLYRQVLELFADKSSYPIYVHCWGGADRTGTVILLLQAILGVADNDLMTDYELTSLSLIGTRSIQSKDFKRFETELNKFGDPSEPMSVKAERYAKSVGVTSEQIEQIREILLD